MGGAARIECSGQAVRLGSRSFELLLELIKRAGEVVSKEELLSTVWAGVVVEEGSVRVHMSTLRKALGKPDEGKAARNRSPTFHCVATDSTDGSFASQSMQPPLRRSPHQLLRSYRCA